MAGNLRVTGLEVTGSADISSNLRVTGSAEISTNLDVIGNTTVAGDISLLQGSRLRFNNPGENDIDIRAVSNNALWVDGDNNITFFADESIGFYAANINNDLSQDRQSYNISRNPADFSIMTDNYMTLLVSGADESVIIGSNLSNYAAVGQAIPGYGSDVKIMLSGSVDSKNGSVRGVVLATGDMVISGAIHSGRLISLEDQNSYVKVLLGNVEIQSDQVVKIQHRTGEESTGSDTNFFVSGSIGIRGTSTKGASVFGGDVVISGSLHDASGNIIYGPSSPSVFTNGLSGSLTQLTDGTSYLIAGANTTITSASNGAITIATTGGAANAFSTFAVAGQSNVVADSETDTLTFVGAGGMTITTDAGSDTITFTSADTGITDVSQDTTPELGGQLVTGDHKIAYATGDNTSEIDFTYNGSNNFTAIASVKSIDMFLDANGGDTGQKFRIFNNLQPASSYAGGTNTDTNAIFMVQETGNVLAKGYVTASMGFSGSLTQLTDGSSYLIAGSNVTINSSSNGSVTISSANTELSQDTSPVLGANLDVNSFTVQGYSGKLILDYVEGDNTDSIALASSSSLYFFLDSNNNATGQYFGIYNNKHYNSDDPTLADSIFSVSEEGNVKTLGYVTASMGFSGSLTQLTDGSSYLIAGTNTTITSASNGAITISTTGGAANAFQTFAVAGQSDVVADSTTDTLTFEAGSNITITTDAASDEITFNASNTQNTLDQAYDHGSGTPGEGAIITVDAQPVQLKVAGASNIALAVTGSAIFGSGSNGLLPALPGVDTNFFVSGSIDSLGTAVRGTSTFGGDVVVSGALDINTVSITSDGKIGIGTDNPSYKLEVGGNAAFGEYLYHRGDTDTFIQFADDSIGITAGGEQLITISEAGQDIVKIGDGGDVDFQVRTLNDDNTLYIDGSTDRIGVGTNSPASIVHIKESAPTLSIQRENNSNDSTIAFLGQAGATGAIMHLSSSNDLVFKTYDGSSTHEIMRLGGHQSSDVRQVILLSGSAMGAGAMQPKESTDINFFASGSMMSKGTAIRGTAVFGGDLVVSGAIYTGRLAAEDTPNNSYVDLTNTVEIRSGDHVEIRPTNNLDIVTQTGAMYFGDDIIDPKAADVNFFISGSIGGKGSSSKTIAAFGGDVYTSGSAYFGSTSIFESGIHEIYSGSSNPTGVFVHDCDNGHLFYHDSLSTNFTANFTNLNLNQSHATTLTLVLSQSATAYIPNAVQIGGAAQTIDWQGNAEPAGTSNGKDVVSFTVVNVAGSYIVLGQLVDFG